MTLSIAYLGPEGTYSQLATLAYRQSRLATTAEPVATLPYPSISRALEATAKGETTLTLVPVENSIEGGVTVTLDMLWRLDNLHIQQAVVMPICHALVSHAPTPADIKVVYSHPQALSQCQRWLDRHMPAVALVPTSSTAEGIQQLQQDPHAASIGSEWAAHLYHLPVLVHNINDYDENHTKFLVLGHSTHTQGQVSSLAFSLSVNAPGALQTVLQIFAQHGVNLSRIESRPTKKSLGDYLFFVDVDASIDVLTQNNVIVEMKRCTETLRIFGSYDVIHLSPQVYDIML